VAPDAEEAAADSFPGAPHGAVIGPVSLLDRVALGVVVLPGVMLGYAYVGYPALLWLGSRLRRPVAEPADPAEWPMVTITVPAYNEADRIGKTLDRLLALDYPADRRQIVVISDASTDATDDIVRGYADRGVELLRQPTRLGKSAAENAVWPLVRGEIIVNIDATAQVPPAGLKALVRHFGDPGVGVVSGRDVSVGAGEESNRGESGYVGYEMWVRRLETRVHSIVGASGCFYGIRRALYAPAFPAHLSRDFASAILAREAGYRAVSAEGAVCEVPRTAALGDEFKRKVRTMQRGLQTLLHKRALLDPFRYGVFAWMLWSHKMARWLPYPLLVPSAVAGAVLAWRHPLAAWLLAAAVAGLGLGVIGMHWPKGRRAPSLIAIPGFIVAANLAALTAWWNVVRGRATTAVWEPTRRSATA
jgi:cellulose synthase/poly-beta-1,6-N-acetylglucosamine synthase-like glycosyltransferase